MVAIYLDGADLATMRELEPQVTGFTTNPSLMRSSGITDYRAFADLVLSAAQGKPVSFEVLADDFETMERQAYDIAGWGENVYVKIPAMLTNGNSTAGLVKRLSLSGVRMNVTAVFDFTQINTLTRSMIYAPAIMSIFCGRIADTGRDPIAFITQAVRVKHADTKLLWASTREVFNIRHAEQAGADIITMTPDLVRKLPLLGKDLLQYSRETVQQFHRDAAGIVL